MIYATFAQLYDDLMEPSMYDRWLSYVSSKIKTDGQILELACGSGRLAVLLKQAGYNVVGFDLSEEMLAIAEQHSRQAQVRLPLIQGDMTDLSQLDCYDYVTCFADSLCYLPNEQMMLQTFREVYTHLNSDGTFLFDVITPYQTDEIYPGYMYNYTDETQAFVWTSYADQTPHSVIHDLTFFVWNENLQAYERLNELHHERTYSLATYQELLKQAGFTKVQVSANFGKSQPDEQTTRWFFECQK